MPRKKDEELKDEPLESDEASEDEAADAETAAEDDDLLPEAAPKAARTGGSGALWAIIVVFIVIVLAVAAYMHREKMRGEAEERRAQQRQVLGTQLGRVKDNVASALTKVDADPADVQGAIGALNTAAGQLDELALSPTATDAGLSTQLADLKSQIRTASRTLDERNTQYLEAVAAAQRELKTAAQDEVKPLAGHLDILLTATYGDVDTPLTAPGVSPVTSGEEPTGEPPKAESQPSEPTAGTGEQPTTGAEPKAENP